MIAQTYHPFPDDKIRVYGLEYYSAPLESFAIQIDTRDTVDGDEVLWLNNQVINDYSDAFLPTCLVADGGSWFAKFLRISLSTGSMEIYNEDLFPLSSLLNAEPEEEHIAAFLQGGYFVLVTVVGEKEEVVLGKEEMVKEFLFEVLRQTDEEPNPDHYLRGKRIKIGAESGLIESFTFNVPEINNPLRGVLRLKQIADDIDDVRPSLLDLFPFEVGDSLHVLETMETVSENQHHEFRYEILEKEYDAVSGRLHLTVKKEFSGYTNKMGEVTMNSGVTTVEWIIDLEEYLDVKLPSSYAELLPGEQELTVSGDVIDLRYYHLRTGSEFLPTNDRREIHFFQEWMWVEDSPNCPLYSAPLGYPSYYKDYFIEGLGGPYFCHNELCRIPVFASVAGQRWGDPLDFTVSARDLIAEKSLVRLFPNPVKSGDQLRVEINFSESIQIEIYNIVGEKIQANFISSSASGIISIDTNGMSTGQYIVKISGTTIQPVAQKLIIQ